MNTTTANQTSITSHIRIIPAWAWIVSSVGFGVAEYFFNVVVPQQDDSFTKLQCLLFGTMLGLFIVIFWLLIGYINRDAQRHGMSAGLWVTVSILVPNGLGILSYFVFRELQQQRPCRHCANGDAGQAAAATI